MPEVSTIWEDLRTHDLAYPEQSFQPSLQLQLLQIFAKNNKESQKRKLLK